MLRRSTRTNALIIAGLLIFQLTPYSYGGACNAADIDADMPSAVKLWGYTLDWSSYTETFNTPPPTGTTNTAWETLHSEDAHNCTANDQMRHFSFSYTKSESIQHSKSGELSMEVAEKVGAKDVAEVGLTAAYKASNGWQWVDSFSQTIQSSADVPLPKCSALRYIYRGKRKFGSHHGEGNVAYTISYRLDFSFEVYTISGECDDTTSDANGNKKYVSFASRTDTITPNCGPNDPCKKCEPTPQPL